MESRFAKWCRQSLGVAALATICTVPTAQAANLEPAGINLGSTSFLDGFGPSHQGFTYLGYLQNHDVSHVEDNGGNDVRNLIDPKISATVFLNQLVYATNATFFNGTGRLAWTALLPVVNFHTSTGVGSEPMLSSNNGLGDLTLGAFIQFQPIMSGGRPVYTQRFEFDVTAPTGRYSTSALINPGSNFWSINPYWAATVLPTPKTEISWRLHYLYNFSNNDPGLPRTRSDKAGQAAWLNYTASYAVTPNLNLGINGYCFRQLTNDTYRSSIPDIALLTGDTGKAVLFAIGPGAFWKDGANNKWAFNVYDQVLAKNHTRGVDFNLHWIHNF